MSKSYGYKRLKRILGLLTAGALASITLPAFGAGFQLQEQNVTNLGTAYAGTGALAEDATVQFYNAAGLSRIVQEQFAIAGFGIFQAERYELTTAVPTFVQANAINNIGPGSVKPRVFTILPAVYYAARLSDSWVFGLSIAEPFGLRTKYDDDSIARYMATATELRTFDISPAIAYSFCNGLSIGAGLDFINAYARYDIAIGNISPALPPYPWIDGYQQNTLSKWGYGYHLAAMYEFNDCDRISLQYRSRVKVKGEGYSITRRAAILPENTQGIKANLRLPDTLLLSAYHAFNESWAVMADAHWTGWKYFDRILFNYEYGATQLVKQHFKNTWRLALGLAYDPCPEWTWRIGGAWDQSPVRDKYRMSRLPDANRYWAAFGGRYRLSKCVGVDFGYSHLFFKKAYLNESAPIAGGNGGVQTSQLAIGNVKSRADIVGLQLTWEIS